MADIITFGVEPEELDRIIANVDGVLREKAIKKAGKEAANLVDKEASKYITRKGYEGDKPGKKDLRTSMGVKSKQYKGGLKFWWGVGARTHAPWKALHSHLYEKGHKMVVSRGSRKGQTSLTKAKVQGKGKFLRVQVNTQPQQNRIIVKTLTEFAEKASK